MANFFEKLGFKKAENIGDVFKDMGIFSAIGQVLVGGTGSAVGALTGEAKGFGDLIEGAGEETREKLEQRHIDAIVADFKQKQQKLSIAAGAQTRQRVSSPALKGESLSAIGQATSGSKTSTFSGTF